MEIRLADLAARIGARVEGDGDLRIRGVAPIREACPGDLTFLASPRFEQWLATTGASAVILPPGIPAAGRTALRADDPYEAFRRAVEIFHAEHRLIAPGVHPTAIVGREATFGKEVAIGAYVVIGDRCVLGDAVMILPGVVIGDDVRIGHRCLVYPRVVIRESTEIGERVIIHAGAIIGDDGFGFLTRNHHHDKMPQVGRVVIEDDVEIGSNACIDRATLGITRIGRGTRIDNLVQVGHNVEIGPDTILCAQVGVAGSTRVGARVVLGGQAGLVHHIEIGNDVQVGAQGGVTKSVPAGSQVSGYPAAPHALARRMYAALRHLPEMWRDFHRLTERVARLEKDREPREKREP
jgi:UDP-3-O-[3-hydroxymyristoyl] glucosamine N-acyltransferase